jgi:hypothetical protein
LLDCVSHFDKCRKCDLLDFFFHVFNKRGRVLWLYLCVLFLVFVVQFFRFVPREILLRSILVVGIFCFVAKERFLCLVFFS